jgi:hypothetical protein
MADGIIEFKLEPGLKKALAATNPKLMPDVMRRSFHRSQRSAVSGPGSAANRAAFGRGGAYAITKKKAHEEGKMRKPWVRHTQKGLTQYETTVVLKGQTVGLWHFRPTVVHKKTAIGPSGKMGKRAVVRVKVLKKGKRTAPRSTINNMAKRWPHKYPEFGGFKMRGNAGNVAGAGAELIWTRKEAPSTASRMDQLPIEPMTTIDVAHMVVGKRTIDAVQGRLKERLPIEFADNMKFYAERAAKRAAR